MAWGNGKHSCNLNISPSFLYSLCANLCNLWRKSIVGQATNNGIGYQQWHKATSADNVLITPAFRLGVTTSLQYVGFSRNGSSLLINHNKGIVILCGK